MDRELLRFQELISDAIVEQKAKDEELTDEYAFTQFVLEAIAEKANIDQPCACNGSFRDRTGQRIEGKISGYGLSPNGEVVNLFYTIYKAPNTDFIPTVLKEEYNQAINRMRGFFKKAVNINLRELEPSSPHYEIVKYINEHNSPEEDGVIGITTVRMFVLTTGFIDNSFKYKEDEPIFTGRASFRNKPIIYASWDFYKLKDIITSQSDHLPIDVDFVNDEVFKGYSIPYVKMMTHEDNYQTLVAILPGEFLYDVYKQYNTDLLQNNVRLFQGFGKVCNKGILNTLKTEPHRFLAYNNGLTATASAFNVGTADDGILHYIQNFQILNGGQTTASIFNAKKDFPNEVDLSKVFVQMKLIVLSENMDEIRQEISLYSNTQTKPNTADYSSNNKFFKAFSKLSLDTIAADPKNSTRFTRWFFERLSKEYTLLLGQKISNAVHSDMSAREKNIAKKQAKSDFENKYPQNQCFTKEEVAKVRVSWSGKPWAAAGGTTLCYKEFGDEMSSTSPDNIYYEDTVALVILLKAMDKEMKAFKQMGSEKAPTIMYTLSMLNKLTKGKLSLYNIWKNQGISESLYLYISELGTLIHEWISRNKPTTATYKDFAKSEKTWVVIQKEKFIMSNPLSETDFKTDSEDKERTQTSNSASVGEYSFVQKFSLAFWNILRDDFGSEFTLNEIEVLNEIISQINLGELFTDSQIKDAKALLDVLFEKGINVENVIQTAQEDDNRMIIDYTKVVDFEIISTADLKLFKDYIYSHPSIEYESKKVVSLFKRPKDIKKYKIYQIKRVLDLFEKFKRTRLS